MHPNLDPSLRPLERGQLFAGWVVGIFIIAAMVVYVADTMRRGRTGTQSAINRELALNVAKAGFENGLSFFRVHSTGCYLLGESNAPTGQAWVTPWPDYPDAAFLPGAGDTDFYSSICVTPSSSVTNSATVAGGIIRDFTMNEYVTYTGSVEMQSSSLWGRYVIRRQNVVNWSPGPDTCVANTDPDACHDLSAIAAQSALGSGTRWSIVSHGYLVRLPAPTANFETSLLSNPAAFAGNSLLSAPLAYYQNQPFLLSQARVYGELSRINFNFQQTALQITAENGLTLNTNGILDGSQASPNNYMMAGTSAGGGPNLNGGSATGILGSPSPNYAPTIASCFPGQTLSSLQGICSSLGTTGSIYGIPGTYTVLPVFNVSSSTFIKQVNQPTFYFITGNTTLLSSPTQTYVLSGVGLAIFNGNLTIQAGNNSSWDGVVFVNGNCTLDGPTNITGILIVTGTCTIGATADLNKTTVSYSPDAVSSVQNLLQQFTVDSSSIITTQF